MATSIKTRFTPSTPCPVCETGTKGCSATDDGFHFCRGTEPVPGWACLGEFDGWPAYRREDDDRRRNKNRDRWGWINDEANWNRGRPPAPATLAALSPDEPVKDWAKIAGDYAARCTTRRRDELAAILHLPVDALAAVPLLGYSPEAKLIDGTPTETGYWTFPERNAGGNIIGVMRRWRTGHGPDGRDKMQMPHGPRGLTIPTGYIERTGPAVNVEGQTNTLAMHRAGFAVTGRPGASAGSELLASLYADLPADRDIIVVGDNDEKADGKWPGKQGAIAIARKVSDATKRLVKWALPPAGFKDVRAYLTGEFWGETDYEVRGAAVRAHLAATAAVVDPSRPVGYESISPEEAKALAATEPAPVPVEPCAVTAAADVREALIPTCCRSPIWFLVERMKTGRRGNVPFGCHRPDCRPCTSQKVYDEFDRTAAWLIRRVQPDHPDTRMVLIGGVVDPNRVSGLIDAVQHRGGLYNWTHTADGEGCEGHLAGPETTSAVFNAPMGNSACLKDRTLFLALVPAGSKLPADLSPVTAAGALRAKGNALQTAPPRRGGVARYRAWSQSHAWGEKPEQKTSEIKVKRPSLFGGRVTKEIVAAWGIGATFRTRDRRIQGTPVGFDAGSRVQNLAAELLLAGVGFDHTPNKDRVIDLGQHWLPKLPLDVGDGPRVEKCLVAHLGNLGLYSIEDELRPADQQDKDEAAGRKALHEIGLAATRGQFWRQPQVERLIHAGRRLIRHIEGAVTTRAVRVRLQNRVRRDVLQKISARITGDLNKCYSDEAKRYATAVLRA